MKNVGHGAMIGTRSRSTGRFRTCAWPASGGSRPTGARLDRAYNSGLSAGLPAGFAWTADLPVPPLISKESPVQLSPAIFKAYDIRGIVPSTLNDDVARALGRAFGTAALAQGERTVAVGRDGRLSGPALSAELIKGLVDAGIEVIDIGMSTTPLLYFAASTLCASGIQVTGSHNPKDYNGFKMVLAGRAIYGEEIQQLRRTMEQQSWQLREGGHVRHEDVLPAYVQRIAGDVKLARPMKIVVDSGNGIAGASAPGIFRALGC